MSGSNRGPPSMPQNPGTGKGREIAGSMGIWGFATEHEVYHRGTEAQRREVYARESRAFILFSFLCAFVPLW